MLISELQAQLEAIKQAYGDLPVCFRISRKKTGETFIEHLEDVSYEENCLDFDTESEEQFEAVCLWGGAEC